VTLASLAPDLDVAVNRQARLGEPSHGGRPVEPPLPFDEHASDARCLVTSTLTAWCEAVLEERDDRPVREIAYMAAWIHARIGRVVVLADAGDCADEIAEITRVMVRAVDSPPELVYAGPCGVCKRPLYCRPGKTTVTCRDHNPAWSGDVTERREWMLGMASGHLAHAAGTVRMLAMLGIRITPVQVTRWVKAGRLQARSEDAAGRPLYRVGDLITLAANRGAQLELKGKHEV